MKNFGIKVIHEICFSRSYNVSNFQDDLKYLYRVSGFEGVGITFIFTDNEIKDEAFLEYLNNVLSAGEVANLFAKDEMDEITNDLTPVMKKKDPKRLPTQDNLYDFFISRARNNLHIVLCFSPVIIYLPTSTIFFLDFNEKKEKNNQFFSIFRWEENSGQEL